MVQMVAGSVGPPHRGEHRAGTYSPVPWVLSAEYVFVRMEQPDGLPNVQ